MASQTAGIQQLLGAEKKAAEKINDARKRKAKRLKQATEEAKAEIEKCRQEREAVFRDYEAKFLGSKDDVQQRIELETRQNLEHMQQSVNNNKENVIKEILSLVCQIEPKVHHNLRLNQ
uniref:V-type proton ATPase subunit G n=1 Tax=Romanomermis culicivorax TaxID=13658 RepID=A0A915KU04_ROMCU